MKDNTDTKPEATKVHRSGILIVRTADIEAKFDAIFDLLERKQERVERLELQVDHLTRRNANLEKIVDRMCALVARGQAAVEGRLVALEEQPGCGCVPWDQYYLGNSVLHELVLKVYPNPDDRPAEFGEVESIQQGFERWGPNYVH